MQVVQKIVLFLLVSALTVLSAAVTVGYLGNICQAFELASHFRFLLLLAFLPGLISLALFRFWKGVAIFLIFFTANALAFVPFYAPLAHQNESRGKFSLLQINAWGPKNTHHDKTLALIRNRAPDVVGVSEITDTWVRDLSEGLPDYKYRVVEKRFGGVSVFSKFPLSNAQVIYYGPIKRPRIVADVITDSGPVTIIFAHTVIPKEQFSIRNGELAEIANQAATAKHPVVVFGDLNCSPWSYYFSELLKVGHLSDSETGFGFQPSWSTQWYFPWVPIDHCLFSHEFCGLKRAVGPKIGSDHLPVYVKLGLRSLSTEAQD